MLSWIYRDKDAANVARMTKKDMKLRIAERLNSSTFERTGDKLSDAMTAIGQVESEIYADQLAKGLTPVALFHDAPDKAMGRGGASRPFVRPSADRLVAPKSPITRVTDKNGHVQIDGVTGGNTAAPKAFEKIRKYGAREMQRESIVSERVALAEDLSTDYRNGAPSEKGRSIQGESVQLNTRVLVTNGAVLAQPLVTSEVHTPQRPMKGANNAETDNRPTMPIWSNHSHSMAHMRQFQREQDSALYLDADKLFKTPYVKLSRPSELVDFWGEVIPGLGGKQSGLVQRIRHYAPRVMRQDAKGNWYIASGTRSHHAPSSFGSTDELTINQHRAMKDLNYYGHQRVQNNIESDKVTAQRTAHLQEIQRETGFSSPVTFWNGGEKYSYVPNVPLIGPLMEHMPARPTIVPVTPGSPFGATFATLRPRAKWFTVNPPVLAMALGVSA